MLAIRTQVDMSAHRPHSMFAIGGKATASVSGVNSSLHG